MSRFPASPEAGGNVARQVEALSPSGFAGFARQPCWVGRPKYLAECPACAAQHAAIAELHAGLTRRGRAAAGVSLAPAVMSRIRQKSTARPPALAVLTRFPRWFLGVGAAAGVALLVLGLTFVSPTTKAQTVAAVMNRAIVATTPLTTVHLQGRMRTRAADNFSSIDVKTDFTPIELWKEFGGEKRWRVEKVGRVAAMDGTSTMLFIRPGENALKIATAARSAFDTEWLHLIANIEQTLANGLAMAQMKEWKVELTSATDAAGVTHKLVTIDAPSGVAAGDYLANKFLTSANTRRLYSFDDQTGRLEALRIYVEDNSDYRLVFEVERIDYNEPIAASRFSIELPAGVTWAESSRPDAPAPVANPEKYAAMTPTQAARAFFEACGREDWAEAAVYFPLPLNDKFKAHLGGVTVVSIGEPFTSGASPSQFVPYEIRLRNGETRQHNLALRKPRPVERWLVSGGL